MFTIAVRGSYPKKPEPPRPWLLGRAIAQWQAGQITDAELERAFQRGMVETVAEMVVAGAEVVWDGQTRWDGPAEFVFRRLTNIRVPLDRLIGLRTPPPSDGDKTENTENSKKSDRTAMNPASDRFEPTAEGKVSWFKPLLVDDFRFLSERSPVAVRPVLTGPYSLAGFCNPGFYPSKESLMMDFAAALNRELEGLEEAGAEFILIEEPLLSSEAEDAEMFFNSVNAVCARINAKLFLAPGGTLQGFGESIARTPFQGFGVQLAKEEDLDLLTQMHSAAPDKTYELGLVDGRTEAMEDEGEALRLLILAAEVVDPALIWVSTFCGMGGLSRETAFEKLRMLHRISERARREMARRECPPLRDADR